MKTKIKNTRMSVVIAVLLLVLSLFGGGRVIPPAFADAGYSSVMTDLQKDSNFSVGDYPAVSDDYSLNVIQIAESTDDELFVYVHNPSALFKPLVATSVNMSFSESATDTHLYELIYVSTYSVFGKYKVKNFSVSAAGVRYYNITSIYRPWDKDIDGDSDNDNEKNEKAYPVGKLYKVETVDGVPVYKCKQVDTVKIVNPFTGYIRRNKSGSTNEYFQDNYFVAFSADRNIDKLLSATVEYRIRDYFYRYNSFLGFENTAFWEKSVFSNEKRTQKDVYCDEVNELHQQGFKFYGIFDLNKNYSWQRIQSSSDFVKTAGASSSDNAEVAKLQWVLMFDETSVYRYKAEGALPVCEETGQKIDEVTILRLEFVDDGVVYNLGAVSDTVSKDHNYGGDGNGDSDKGSNFWAYIWNCILKLFKGKATAWEKFVAIVSLILAVIAFAVVVGFLKWLYKMLFK